MTDKQLNIILKFGIIYVLMALAFVGVIVKIIQYQYVERADWMKLAETQTKRDIVVNPKRGNIYADDGRLLASSIPTYAVWMDVKADALCQHDGKLFKENLDSLSIALSQFFGDRSAAQYKRMLSNAYQNRDKKRHVRIYPGRISYSQMKALYKLPLYRLGSVRSGLIGNEYVRRVKPFGSLAARTIGDVYADESLGGRSGIEGSFNDYLVGVPGLSSRVKASNRFVEMVDVPPVDGKDIYTTLDIEIQDIAEKALRDVAVKYKPRSACAIVMEVKTGEIKAMVNLDYNAQSDIYYEGVNHALTDRIEPGSTFKIASLIAVLDEGKVKKTDVFDVGDGTMQVANRTLRDHNAHRGGFGKITVAEVIHGSSNVGTAKMVMKSFEQKPEKFIEKLYDLRLNDSLAIQMKGVAKPWIKHPVKDKKSWSKVSLAWMSMGYETMIPPIYTLTLYNAIANDGKMMKPLFVREIRQHDEIIKSYEPEVLKKSICKTTTLKDVQEIMLGVIEGEKGTAKNMRSDIVRIAGKTGTAQIAEGGMGHKAGQVRHNVSFCGYFPAEKPLYTAFVLLTAPEGLPSGGLMAGSAVKTIAERTMIYKSQNTPAQLAADTTYKVAFPPKVKIGNTRATNLLAEQLEIPLSAGGPDMVGASTEFNHSLIPDVTGMGAKDAVFVLGNLGLKVKLRGIGAVVAQHPDPGMSFKKGNTIDLLLE